MRRAGRARTKATSVARPVLGLWAIVAIPFVVALVSFVGDRWIVTGDWAAIDLRIRQVGTADTPLIGAYSTRGWAHPGPIVFWLGAPLHQLSGGDPRSMMWTAAIVNLSAIGGILWVLHRRGGTEMAVVGALACALLAHGLGPGRIIDIWNPILPLFPLLLVGFLAWSAATGEAGHAIGALAIGALVAQAHVGMAAVVGAVVTLAAVVAVVRSTIERRPAPSTGPTSGDDPAPTDLEPRHPPALPTTRTRALDRWPIVLGAGAVAVAIASIPPLLDQATGIGNLGTLARYFTGDAAQPVGLRRGVGLVSRYVRPDGPWLGGPEPTSFTSVIGSGALPIVAMLAVLTALTVVLWRRGRRDLAAGTAIAAGWVVASAPVAARVDEPVFDYLVKWLATVSAFAWFWVAWGTWTLVRPALGRWASERSWASRAPRFAASGAVALVAAAALWSAPAATSLPFPAEREAAAVEVLVDELTEVLPVGERLRFEHRGDDFGNVASGVIRALRLEGYDVVTSDGATGLKYGPDAVWAPGDDPSDVVYTVAVDYPYNFVSPRDECRDAGAEIIASSDELSEPDRRRLEDLSLERLFTPETITEADQAEADALGAQDFVATVYRAPDVCASGP